MNWFWEYPIIPVSDAGWVMKKMNKTPHTEIFKNMLFSIIPYFEKKCKIVFHIFGQSGTSCPYKWLLVGPTASKTRSSQSVTVSLLSKRPSLFCLIHFGGPWGQLRGRRHPSMEDDLWWKTTFDGRRPSMEDNLRWKMTFDGRWSSMEDDLWWKTTFDGIRPLMEDDLWWKTTFDGRRPFMEDDLWRKTTLDGIWHSTEENLWW